MVRIMRRLKPKVCDDCEKFLDKKPEVVCTNKGCAMYRHYKAWLEQDSKTWSVSQMMCPICRSTKAEFIKKIETYDDVKDLGKTREVSEHDYEILKKDHPYKYRCMNCGNSYCSSKKSKKVWSIS